MPIPIIIAIFVALFTLGTQLKPKSDAAPVAISSGMQQAVKTMEDQKAAAIKAQQQPEQRAPQADNEPGAFENIFQLSGLYHIIKAEPVNVLKQSINSNVTQVISLSEKE